MRRLILAVAVALSSAVSVRTASPVEKVVELVQELKAKIQADGEAEQKIYDKFACWCETTTQRKADSIDSNKATIGTATTAILKFKATVATLGSEIAAKEKEVADTTAQMQKLTGIREKENSDYQQQKSETETTLDALNRAINTLSGAGTGGDMGLLRVASSVRSALLGSPKLNALSEKSTQLLRSFLADPAAADYYDQKAQAKQSFSPQSATIQGILKDMYQTFATDLEKANQEESKKQKAFEDLMADLTQDNANANKVIAEKQKNKADNEKNEAEQQQLLEDTQAQLADDEKFFEAARDSCKRKSDEWDERGRLRTEELDGINKALEILTSDESRQAFATAENTRPVDTFGSAGVAGTFVQLSESVDKRPHERAYHVLKKVSSETKNLRLAALAVSIKFASKGHFDAVIGSIDGMTNDLHEEQEADITQRDWCIDTRHKNRAHRDNKIHEIERLTAAITKLENKNTALAAEVAKTEQDVRDIEASLVEVTQTRRDENSAFATAKSDDETAIGILEDAIAAMSEYGANNLALIQKREPVFEVSEDQASDATFSSKDNYAGATDGIVKMLTMIKENLQLEVEKAGNGEVKAQNEFFQMNADAYAAIAAMNEKITNLNAAIADNEAEIGRLTQDRTDAETEKTDTQNYLDGIRANCDFIEGSFEQRAANRQKETEGLGDAKALLSGAAGFLQRK